MPSTRPAAVAGMFYPDHPSELRAELARCAQAARAPASGMPGPEAPKLIVVPHAGYVYSGPVAASAYATLVAARGFATVERAWLPTVLGQPVPDPASHLHR